MNIVDTHVHIWDIHKFRLPWLDAEGSTLNRTWSLKDYRTQCDCGIGYSIDKAVYIEVDMEHQARERENAFVVDLVDDETNCVAGGCISGDLTAEHFVDYIRPWVCKPQIKGVRQVLHVPTAAPQTCLGATFVSNVRLLGELGLVFEGCVRNQELGDLAALAIQCPDTTIVVDHMGIVDADIAGSNHPDEAEREYLDKWKRNMVALGRLHNTVCKISGLNPVHPWTHDSLRRAVDVAFESFEPEQVMFASNFPVLNVSMTLDDWVSALLEITDTMPLAYRQAFFSTNAERVYRL